MVGHRRAALVASASLVALVAASSAQAQSVRDTRRPATPSEAPLAAEVPLDAITVTSTKTEERAINAMSGTSVVTREQINTIQPSRISDILSQVPGVTTQENQNDPATAINIRGLQDFGRVNVLIDGARQDYATTGHAASGVFYLDPELVGGIDITRGPTSTIYGSGAIGGVAYFRTRGIDDILLPDERTGFVQKWGFGTNGQKFLNSSSVGARFGDVGRIGPSGDIFGQFVYRQNDAYRDGLGTIVRDTGNELQSGLAKFNVRPADGHEISGTALIQRFDFANNGTSNTGARFDHRVQSDTYTLGYRFSRPDVPLFDFSAKGYYVQVRDAQRFLNDSASRTYGALGVRPGDQLVYDQDSVGFDVSNTARFDTGPLSHALTVGTDGVFNTVRTSDRAGGFGQAFTPSGERRLLGAFVQDEVRYGGWLRVLGALRYDDYEIQGGQFRSGGSRLSPKITVGVSPWGGPVELYGTYAEGYRAPTVTETLISGIHPFPAFSILPNTALRPEVAHNIEGGVNVKLNDVFRPGDTFRGKVNGFYNEIDNFIDFQAIGPTYLVPAIAGIPAAACANVRVPRFPCVIPVTSFQYVNARKAELSGVEVEAAYDWGGGFVSVAASHVEGIDPATRRTFNTIPPDRVSTTLGLRFLDNALTVGSRVTMVDSRTNTNPGTTILSTKAYALWDLFASYQVNDTIRADFVVQNILNKRYTQYLNLLPSPGTIAKVAVTMKFATR